MGSDKEVISGYVQDGGSSGEIKKLKKKKKKDRKPEDLNGNDLMGSVESNTSVEKKRKKKRHGAASELVDNNSMDTAGSLEVDNGVEKKRKKKRHSIASEHIDSESIDMLVSLEVDNGVEKKKKKKRKSRELDNDFASGDVPTETRIVICSAEVDTGVIKKKKKRKIPVVSNSIPSEDARTENAKVMGSDHAKVHSSVKKKKKKKSLEISNAIATEDMPSEKVNKQAQGTSGCVASENIQNVDSSEIVTDSKKRHKRKKTKKLPRNSDNLSGEKVNEKEGSKTGKKRKRNPDATDSSKKSKSERKRVSFSDTVEVFNLPEHLKYRKLNSEGDVVQGKRYTPEEDAKIKQAIDDYIVEHGLAKNIVDKDTDENWKKARNMIMNCKEHKELKGCWKDISLAIPWRTPESIYQRAHLVFERADDRNWTKEEIDMVLSFHKKNGPKWRELGDFLGKSRKHVKDAYRRNKLSGEKKGAWSQEEYQKLFDLVNHDICLKAVQEKKVKHGMLRDNIAWGAISDSIGTRAGPTCCTKWYYQLCSSMVLEGKWSDTDDYRLVDALYNQDVCCIEDVEWDNLLEHRSGDLCQKRWAEMARNLGEYRQKPFLEQVEVLHQRYNQDLVEAREIYEKKEPVDV